MLRNCPSVWINIFNRELYHSARIYLSRSFLFLFCVIGLATVDHSEKSQRGQLRGFVHEIFFVKAHFDRSCVNYEPFLLL